MLNTHQDELLSSNAPIKICNLTVFSFNRQTVLGIGSQATTELQECVLLQYRQRSDILPIQQRFWTFELGDGAPVFAGTGPTPSRQELLQQSYLPLLHFGQG